MRGSYDTQHRATEGFRDGVALECEEQRSAGADPPLA